MVVNLIFIILNILLRIVLDKEVKSDQDITFKNNIPGKSQVKKSK